MEEITLEEFLNKDSHYFSEGHLEGWFKDKYLGLTKKEVKTLLKVEHDNSLEIESAENEIGRELTDIEKKKVIKKFRKSVIKNIKFRREIAIKYWDSLDNLNI